MNNLIQTILKEFDERFSFRWKTDIDAGQNVVLPSKIVEFVTMQDALKSFIDSKVREAVEKAFEEVDTTVEITKNNFLSH